MVSVIVLTHNRRRLLESCLRSLFQQDCPPEDYEIIVADDGSSDDTAGWVKGLASIHANLHYVCQPQKGIAAARNLGLSAARGEFVSFVADDYELAPDYLRTISRLMNRDSATMVVRFKVVAAGDDFSDRIGAFYYSLGVVKRIVRRTPENAGRRWAEWNLFKAIIRYKEQPTTDHGLEAAGGAAYRRRVFDIAGVFDESLQRSEDADMGVRLRRNNIEIYHYPDHQIRHHYERFPDEALRKSFRTGVNRYLYHRKHRSVGGSGAMIFIRAGVEKVLTSAAIFFYCGRNGRLLELLFLSPFLLLLEVANKLGYLTAMLAKRS